jgi:oxygen-independent coproporphyrinogen-3 oxidase
VEPLGLYLHIPFCSAICNYCNFNRGLFDKQQKSRYVNALLAEIANCRMAEWQNGRISDSAESANQSCHPAILQSCNVSADTIYFGGGTPSLLEPSEVGGIIAACRDAFDVSADAEVTLEANPESVDTAKLVALRRAGVNRLSFGVQSFRDAELRRLSRLHDAGRARAALAEARAAGFDNVSLDLMMWLPGQRVEEWLASIDAAIVCDPDHLSLYLLEVYPNAPLKDDMARARWSQAPDDDAATMYVTAMERLEAAGYEQYEISNVAKAGRRSRHNLKYWTDGEWHGLGCGAHGTVGGVRTKNVSGIDDYIDRVSRGVPVAVDTRRMDAAERLGDVLFTGLRLTDGLNLETIRQRYGVDVWERYSVDLNPFVDAGLLRHDGGRLALTRAGMLLANEVMAVFV